MTFQEAVSQRIYELCEKNKITPNGLAEASRIPPSTLQNQMGVTSKNLNNFLNGKTTSVSFRYLEDICTFLEG